MRVLPRSRERSQRIRKIEEREFAKGQAEMYLDEGCAGRVPHLYADSHFSFLIKNDIKRVTIRIAIQAKRKHAGE